MNNFSSLIPPHGGYRKLRSFQTAQLVYDATVIFCDRFIPLEKTTDFSQRSCLCNVDRNLVTLWRIPISGCNSLTGFIDKRSRTHDQMVQAARSGVQNIAEGSMASATSKKIELKLTGIARASLEELLLDYEDFLRQHKLRLWDKSSPEALAVRKKYLSDSSDMSDQSDPYNIKESPPEKAANTIICLVNQASYLLGRQLRKLEEAFLAEGGFTERMYRERQKRRLGK